MLELIGLHEDLVELTCRRILEYRQGSDLSSVVVVFPSRRFGFFLRQELSRKMKDNFFPPAMYPIEVFFESLFRLNFPGIRVQNELESAYQVYESAAAVFASGIYGNGKIADFPAFLPWAQKVLKALEEILTEGGETEGINWENYEEFTKLGEYHRPYKEFIQKIPVLLDHLRQSLRRRRQATKAMTWREVADLAEKGGLQTPPAQNWILSGFNALNTCERKLFRFLSQERQIQFILRTDPRALDDPRSPIHLQAETIDALDLERPLLDFPSRAWNDLTDKVTIHSCDGMESEVFHVFHKLVEICRGRSEEDLRKVAVLLPSPSALIPFVQGVVSRFDQEKAIRPFNITLGYPLERTPMMQLIDSMLTVMENSPGGDIQAVDYLQLIRHPYVKISSDRGGQELLKRGIHLLEDIINHQNLTHFSLQNLCEKLTKEIKDFQEMDGELSASVLAEVQSMHRRFVPVAIENFTALLHFFRQAIESIGSEGNHCAHLFLNEYAAAAMTALDELEDFAAAREDPFRGAGMAELMRAHFRGRTIAFEGSPLKGIQVMGPLEFRGLSFDEVIVLDAVEGVLPGTTKYDPILPADIRTIFKIRDYGDWEKVYAFNFFALLGAAGRIHIFYPRDGEEGRDRERSRFIERIVYEIEKRTGSEPETAAAPLPFSIPARELKKVKKSKAIRDKLESLTLSPSALESFINCPLQFYFRKVLGLTEREELASESDGDLIGTIAHETLSAFYKKYSHAAAMAAAGSKVLECDLELFLFTAFRDRNFDPEHGLERIRAWTLKEQLRKFIRADQERMEVGGIRVESLEEWLSVKLQVPGRLSPVTLKGRLDRCEAQGNLLRVIDYKTGSPFIPKVRLNDALDLRYLFQKEEKDCLDSLNAFREKYPGMQLHLYLMLLTQEKGKSWGELDAAYAFLREQNKFVHTVFAKGRGDQEFSPEQKMEVMTAFSADLQEILTDLYAREYFLANPGDDQYCSYCPFRTPCGNQ